MFSSSQLKVFFVNSSHFVEVLFVAAICRTSSLGDLPVPGCINDLFISFLLRPLRLIRSLPNPSVGLSSKLAVMACLILLLQIKRRGALNSKQFTHLSAVSKQSFIMEL